MFAHSYRRLLVLVWRRTAAVMLRLHVACLTTLTAMLSTTGCRRRYWPNSRQLSALISTATASLSGKYCTVSSHVNMWLGGVEVEVEVEEGSLVPSMHKTGPEGHYTANRQNTSLKSAI